MWFGVVRDEYQLPDGPILAWVWLPFVAGLTCMVVASLVVLVASLGAYGVGWTRVGLRRGLVFSDEVTRPHGT